MYKSVAGRAAAEAGQAGGMTPLSTSTPSVAPSEGNKQPAVAATPPRPGLAHELEKRAEKAEKSLAELRKDFDEYREEKQKNYEMVNKELADVKEALNEAR
jgi:hypothetical protein